MTRYNKGTPSFIVPIKRRNWGVSRPSKSASKGPKKLYGVDKIEQGKKELVKGVNKSKGLKSLF